MKIYTDSWHYRYVARYWTERPEALCWYFWKIVITMFGMAAIGTIVLGIALGAIFFLSFPLWQWFFDYDPEMQIGILVLWWVIGLIVSIKYRIYLYDSGQLKRKIRVREYKEPGLVSQYLHAKHRKICPLLKYVNRQ